MPGRSENMVKNRFHSYIKRVYQVEGNGEIRPEYLFNMQK